MPWLNDTLPLLAISGIEGYDIVFVDAEVEVIPRTFELGNVVIVALITAVSVRMIMGHQSRRKLRNTTVLW